jgi:TPR repeat protein
MIAQWRIWGLLSAAVVVIQSFGTTSAFADEAQQVTSCDLLTWSPHDPNAQDGGYFEMDAPKAIAACEAALAEQPGIARLQSRYGMALWRADRHSESLAWTRTAAEQGYAPAQADLAYFYRHDPDAAGYPKAKAYTEGFRLVRLAAEQGNIIAIGDLGNYYRFGWGVERNYDEALKWFRRAVEHDERYAESHLGEMYKNGLGVPQDDAEAVKWFRRSAEQGYNNGEFNLALMLLDGRGVARDRAAAEELLSRAAEKDLPEARSLLERLRAKQ